MTIIQSWRSTYGSLDQRCGCKIIYFLVYAFCNCMFLKKNVWNWNEFNNIARVYPIRVAKPLFFVKYRKCHCWQMRSSWDIIFIEFNLHFWAHNFSTGNQYHTCVHWDELGYIPFVFGLYHRPINKEYVSPKYVSFPRTNL